MDKKTNKKWKYYRLILALALLLSALLFLWVLNVKLNDEIPSRLYWYANRENHSTVDLLLPATGELLPADSMGASNIPKGKVQVDLKNAFYLPEDGNYRMQVKLFGILPFKEVEIQTLEERELIPVGRPVGIYLKAKGILVVGVGNVEGEDGSVHTPAAGILHSGDYIRALNGESMEDKETFVKRIQNSEGQELNLQVERNGSSLSLTLHPVKDREGIYRIGIWIRDNAQGVGTMTYMDAEGHFGALGHGISDVDTKLLMHMEDGTLYETSIVDVRRGFPGEPGELIGQIIYNDHHVIGDINGNSERGIFGSCNAKGENLRMEKPVKVGLKQEIEKGQAQLFCAINGEPRYYDIQILRVHLGNDNVNRGIEFDVTDPALIASTGGVVQGMSGAPILQNGKLIGAVTHVLVNDPTKGYGIFIENMLEH